MLIINVCMLLSCRKKCKKSDYYSLDDPLIDLTNDVSPTPNNNTNSNNIYLFTDSAALYSNFSLPPSYDNIDFNSYSVIFVSLTSKEMPNKYIENIRFSLADEGSNYVLTITFCTYKKNSLGYRRSYKMYSLIKSNKLVNKPITIIRKNEY